VTCVFSLDDLRALAARASTIDERLAGGYMGQESPKSARAAARRLAAWCKSATDGDEQLFRKRLAMDGLDVETVQHLLGDVQLSPEHPLPTWAGTLRWAAEAMVSSAGTSLAVPGMEPGTQAAFLEAEQPLPFEELFEPLVAAARERRDRARGRDAGLLTESAHAGLQRALLFRLTTLCGPSLFEGFTLCRIAAKPHALFHGVPLVGDSGSRALYERYIATLRRGELRTFLGSRPVLARLVATITELWISATTVFLERLEADFPAICDRFRDGSSPGTAIEVRGGLSDPHNGGKTVLKITFADGLELGYKPKDLGLDVAWRKLLRWLDERAAPPSAGAPEVLLRAGYGWVEWIPPTPCADKAGAEHFFERAGAMLCLLQFLRGTDFHFENVLAHGEVPTPVDLETLMHPSVPDPWRAPGETARGLAAKRLRDSVLATSYLPKWIALPNGHSAAIGGLNAAELQRVTRWGFKDVNTDGMSFEELPAAMPQTPHLPTVAGKSLSVVDCRSQIERGYAAMYRFLMTDRAALFDAKGPLVAFHAQVVRVVLRPTILYTLLLRKSLNKQNLTDGIDWSLHFDFLARFSDFFDERDELWEARKAERRALEKLDVPHVTGRSDSTDLFLPDNGTLVEDFFEETAFEQLMQRAERMSEAALDGQIRLIGQALQSVHGRVARRASADSRPASGYGTDDVNLETDTAVTTARVLAAKLEEQAIQGRDGATWIGAVPLPGENQVQLEVLDHNLYSGTGGIGLFLSALHCLTDDGAYRDLALAAFAPFRLQLREPHRRARLARVMGIGGASGLGSLVYALARSASLLEDPLLLEDALRTSHLLTDTLIAADRSYDVIAGAAGAVLGLLALHRTEPEPLVLDRAVACGCHLVESQRDCSAGGRAWRTLGDRELTGFSHGASGIALALLRLYQATGMRRFLLAAREGIRYEDALFSAESGNWLDLREASPRHLDTAYACQWCHGAPGIGLARLGALEVLDEPSVRYAIDVAIQTTTEAPDLRVDHLCCGNFGRLELLFAAGQRMGSSDLTLEALRRAGGLVARARDSGGFRWPSGLNSFSPGFFTGLSGVGYEILRLAHPAILPSVLLWD
jgi:type 2 lantibiotic biosynthesis protein LanM